MPDAYAARPGTQQRVRERSVALSTHRRWTYLRRAQ